MYQKNENFAALETVMEWLAGEHFHFANAVKSMDLLCAHAPHMKDEIAGSSATGKIVLYSARHLAAAVQSCKVANDPESHHIWEDSAHHQTDPEMLERAEYSTFKTIWSAMRHRRKLFGHKLSDVKSVFDAADTDGTGKLSFDEFAAAMKRLDLGLTEEQLQEVFDATDLDGSGKLNYAEFAEELHLRHATPRQTYAHRMACLLRLLTTMSMGRLVQVRNAIID